MITAFCGKDRPRGLMAFGCDSFHRSPEEGVCRENTPHRMNEITGCSSDGRARGLGAGTPNRFDFLKCCTLLCFSANSPNNRS